MTTGWNVTHPTMQRLLPIALTALEAEDRALAHAILQRSFDCGIEGVNPGLGFGLFEHAVVYSMVKAWLPHVRVRQEVKHEWWSSMSAKARGLLAHDTDRLRRRASGGGYLLLLWWDFDTTDEAYEQRIVEQLAADTHATAEHLAHFPTRIHAPRHEAARFTLAALRVDRA